MWYNIDKLNKYAPDAIINFIIGQRRIGKTYFFQKMAIERYEANKSQTLWLRNRKTEFDSPFSEDFMNGMNSIGVGCDGQYKAKPNGLYHGDDLVVKFQSISTFSNIRGNAYPDINMIVFDEFCPEDRRYPKNCHTGLMSITKTILSGKEDAKVYCLSNYISVANPYFVGYNIYPNEKYDVTNFPNKKVCIEVCRGYDCAIESDNPWNDVYNAGGYLSYDEASEDNLYSLIIPCPKNTTRYRCHIKSDNVIYGLEIGKDCVYWHKCNPTHNAVIYGKTLRDCSADTSILPSNFIHDLKVWNENNYMRYSDANTMFVILSIIFNNV